MANRVFQIIEGDALEVLRTMPTEWFDSMVTDPPAGIEFMGKAWDRFSAVEANPSGPQTEAWHDNKGANPYARSATPRFTGKRGMRNLDARAGFIAVMTAIFTESLRVLKPGAYALVWSIPRTSHWTATALEDAGFEIRDVVVHLFGTGFPKSLNVSKAIDKAAGAKREIVGRHSGSGMTKANVEQGAQQRFTTEWNKYSDESVTEAARQWEGWGTALKPAAEHWILCRKPLIGTVAANVIEHGTGGLNIDGCRIGTGGDKTEGGCAGTSPIHGGGISTRSSVDQSKGRWPANVVLSHTDECELVGERTVESTGHYPAARRKGGIGQDGHGGQSDLDEWHMKGETVSVYNCIPECPIRMLDEQSGERPGCRSSSKATPRSKFRPNQNEYMPQGPIYPDTGTASRFYYQAKPPKRERNLGGIDNRHPTVKSAMLMQYFCRLITPPGGSVLDPFCGSGSTGIGALREGFIFFGIERDEESVIWARARIIADSDENLDCS